MNVAIDPALSMTLRVAIAILLASAARHKLRDLPSFRAAMTGYSLLPLSLLMPVSAGLVVAEILVAVGLLIPAAAAVAGAGAAMLFTLYGAAIAINLARGRRDIDCGCAGPLHRQPISHALVWRNLVLVTASVAAAVPVGERILSWLDFVTFSAAVAVLALLYVSIDALLAQVNAFEAYRA